MHNSILQCLKEYESSLNSIWRRVMLEKGVEIELTEEQESKEFTQFFLEAVNQGASSQNLNSHEFDPLYDFLSGVAGSRAKRGFSPRETAQYILSFKEAASRLLSQVISEPEKLFAANLELNSIADNLTITSFESFIQGRDEVIERQCDEISEISTPVIQVWEGVVALPIIGTLDSSRTQVVMENLLEKIVQTGSSIAILDISGVPAVDSLVAQHLIKTVNATRLMGAECIISGIRPEIAQTVVHLGIDLTSIITKATLASALRTAFGLLEIAVSNRN